MACTGVWVLYNVNEKYSLPFYRIDKGYRFINMNFSFLHSTLNMQLLYTSPHQNTIHGCAFPIFDCVVFFWPALSFFHRAIFVFILLKSWPAYRCHCHIHCPVTPLTSPYEEKSILVSQSVSSSSLSLSALPLCVTPGPKSLETLIMVTTNRHHH